MPLVKDKLANLVESLNVTLLGRLQGILPKMRQNLCHEIPNIADLELEGLIRSIRPNETTFPHRLDLKQQLSPVSILTDRETRPDLPAKAMPLAGNEGDTETAFAVYVSRDVRGQIHWR